MTNPNFYLPQHPTSQAKNIFVTKIQGLYYIGNQLFSDERGFFTQFGEIPHIETAVGHEFKIKQLNHSRSENNVIRGFHAEGWNKLVTIAHGTALCLIVDVRPDSETFLSKEYFLMGKSEGTLTGSLYLPAGVGNSICVIEGPVDYIYAVDQLYSERDTSGDVAISLLDPDIRAEWPISQDEMVISDRDKQGKTLRELYPEKF